MKGKVKTYCVNCRRETWCRWQKDGSLRCQCNTRIDLRPTRVATTPVYKETHETTE